jgi:FkbM family methyltransferase
MRINETAKDLARRLGAKLPAVGTQPLWVTRDRLDRENMRRLVAFVLGRDDAGIDVGAHRGCVLAEICRVAPGGRHIALEPLPTLAAYLRGTFPKVTVLETAAWNRPGEATFNWVRAAEGWSGLKLRPLPGDLEPDAEQITVQLARLDDLIDPKTPPRLIKIDVEGAERQVLEGALSTLLTFRPVVIFEHGSGSAEHFGTSPTDLHELLTEDARMRIFDLDGGGPYSRGEFERVFTLAERVNFVATPS